MSTENLKTIITALLQDFPELFVADQLNITKLISIVCPDGKSTELADKIIAKLLNNPTTKQHFFSINNNYCLFKASDILNFFGKATKHTALILGLPTKLAWQKVINISNIVAMWC